MAECRLTTVDNPYDPFDDFDKWLAYDNDNDYGTSELVGRIAMTSDSLTDEENDEETERAIDDFIKYSGLGAIYKKVKRRSAA